jgi:hypothetical protein
MASMRSSTRRARGPICHTISSHPPAGGKWPVRGRRPEVGLMPAIPEKAAGSRTEPAASLPRPKWRAAGRDERGFPAAAAAAGARHVVGIVGLSEDQVGALESEEKVGQIGARDGDGAGAAQARDQRGVGSGGRGVLAAQCAGGAARAGLLDRVLDTERHTVQRAAQGAGGQFAVGRGGIVQRAVVRALPRRRSAPGSRRRSGPDGRRSARGRRSGVPG